eukprot:6816759-Prymnesium_polylepis.1
MDTTRLFKNYVLALQKKVEVNEEGQSFIRVTYTRKACGGRRYSIGQMYFKAFLDLQVPRKMAFLTVFEKPLATT